MTRPITGVERVDANLLTQGRRLAGSISYLETFSVSDYPIPESIAYATASQQLIAKLDIPPACGWVVDLRRNAGGEVITMSLAIAPLWGEGEYMRDRDIAGAISSWSYAEGVVTNEFTPQADETIVATPYQLPNPNVPIAILLSQKTVSMGEVTARALMNRSNAATRTFGETIYGWD